MFKKIDDATTPAEMRAALECQIRDDAIINQCLHMARYQGMSAEDTYSMLAYHAMRALIDCRNANIELLNTMPRPPMVWVPKS